MAQSHPDTSFWLASGRKAVARIEFDNGVSLALTESDLPLCIGRDPDTDIRIPFPHVSRHHCKVGFRLGILYIEDTSTNGTIVNNKLIIQRLVPIEGPSTIFIAREVGLMVSPVPDTHPCAGASSLERRRGERRQGDRRQHQLGVDFERRHRRDRRRGDRRNMN